MASEPFELLEFTRVWTDNTPEHGFKTYEDREDVVRADMQLLFDELKEALNKVVGKLNDKDFDVSVDADDVVFTSTPAVTSDNVQAAIEEVQANVISAQLGQIVDHSITGAKLSRDVDTAGAAVNRENIQDDAVNGDKIDDGAVDYNHLATDAVRRDAIKDGEVTNDKLAPGVLPNKADLVDGIVNPAQLRLRRIIRPLETAVSTYDVAQGDIGSYLEIDAWDVAGGVSVNISANSLIQPGSFFYLDCGDYVRRISSGSGVSLYVSGSGSVGSYEVEANEVILLIKKSSSPDVWELIPVNENKKPYHASIMIGNNWGSIVAYPDASVWELRMPIPSSFGDVSPVNVPAQPYKASADTTADLGLAAVSGKEFFEHNIRLAGVTSTQLIFHADTQPSRAIMLDFTVTH